MKEDEIVMKILVLKKDQELQESKVVTFEGEPAPKFGWAVVMAGGAGSGKGYVINNRILLPNKTIDVDELKKQYLKLKIKNPERYEDDGISFDKVAPEILSKINNKKRLTTKEISEVIKTVLKNPKYVSILHGIVRSKNWKDKIVNSFLSNTDLDKLPNIVFDMTGDAESKLIRTASKVKKYGYKTALVWVITNFEVAKSRNAKRDRSVSDKILTNTHQGAKNAILGFLEKPEATKYYDEIWLIINSPATDKTNLTKEEKDILNKMPCIQLEKEGAKFDFSQKTKSFLLQFLSKENEDNQVLNYLSNLINKNREKGRRQHRPS